MPSRRAAALLLKPSPSAVSTSISRGVSSRDASSGNSPTASSATVGEARSGPRRRRAARRRPEPPRPPAGAIRHNRRQIFPRQSARRTAAEPSHQVDTASAGVDRGDDLVPGCCDKRAEPLAVAGYGGLRPRMRVRRGRSAAAAQRRSSRRPLTHRGGQRWPVLPARMTTKLDLDVPQIPAPTLRRATSNCPDIGAVNGDQDVAR